MKKAIINITGIIIIFVCISTFSFAQGRVAVSNLAEIQDVETVDIKPVKNRPLIASPSGIIIVIGHGDVADG